MHSAPAVSFPVGRSRFQGGLLGVLIVSGALTVVAWSLQADALGWRHGLAASVCLAVSALAVWHGGWRSPKGHLAWDGAAWYWAVDAQSVVVVPEVVVDFQRVVLVRLRDPAGGFVTWVWLDHALNPRRWAALRRAIYTRNRRRGDSATATDVLASPDNAPRRAS